MSDVAWMTAFVDLPAAQFDAGVRFWSAVTGSTLSPRRGTNQEFATLVPPDGDAFLRVQRVEGNHGGTHLDLHTDDVGSLVRRAEGLGAQAVADCGYVVMSSPGSMAFCVVQHHGESVRPKPRNDGSTRCLVDQMALDIPAPLFDAECTFWASLMRWELRAGSRPEFSVLVRPSAMPLRLLLQRLGPDDPRETVTAHLDVACGDAVASFASAHEALGATVVRRESAWITMADPTGAEYCLTSRDPSDRVLLLRHERLRKRKGKAKPVMGTGTSSRVVARPDLR
jgi:hypothetical protein